MLMELEEALGSLGIVAVVLESRLPCVSRQCIVQHVLINAWYFRALSTKQYGTLRQMDLGLSLHS